MIIFTCLSSINEYFLLSHRDCLITSFVNASTSLFAGVTVFAYLGYLAHLTHTTVQTVTGEGKNDIQ